MASREDIQRRVDALSLRRGVKVETRSGDRCALTFEEDGVHTDIEFPLADESAWQKAEQKLPKRDKRDT